PTAWVVGRGEPVAWSVPADTAVIRLIVVSADSAAAGAADSVVVDVELEGGGSVSTGVLPAGPYRYRAVSPGGEIITEGRFDVAGATAEMLPVPTEPAPAAGSGSAVAAAEPVGTPLRTRPWPYLLVIGLLCGEWIGRRRSGLR
ncbi:MAG TPA: hypothetical protein VMM35_10330, partial [Longimicrobiales bacterium]|nr:hypothetical protein [Longimicrobiales bacterium]